MIGELLFAAAANLAVFIGISGYIDYKLHAPKKNKRKGFIE